MNSLAKRDPFDVDNIFNSFFQRGEYQVTTFTDEKLTSYGLQLAVPGVKREDIEVELTGRRLTVSWTDWHGKKRKQSYDLKWDSADPKVTLADGILTVSLPQAESKKLPVE